MLFLARENFSIFRPVTFELSTFLKIKLMNSFQIFVEVEKPAMKVYRLKTFLVLHSRQVIASLSFV